jgi:hypothetical protein
MDRQTSNLSICSLSAGRAQHNLYLHYERRENTPTDRLQTLLSVVCQQHTPTQLFIFARRNEESTWTDRQATLLYVVCQQGAPSTTYISARREEKIHGKTDKQSCYM